MDVWRVPQVQDQPPKKWIPSDPIPIHWQTGSSCHWTINLANRNFKHHPISFASQFPVSSSVTSSPKTCTSRPFTTSTTAPLSTSLPPKRLAKTATLSTKRRDKKALMVVVNGERIATTYSDFDKQLGFLRHLAAVLKWRIVSNPKNLSGTPVIVDSPSVLLLFREMFFKLYRG